MGQRADDAAADDAAADENADGASLCWPSVPSESLSMKAAMISSMKSPLPPLPDMSHLATHLPPRRAPSPKAE